jgi:hypothetical protein
MTLKEQFRKTNLSTWINEVDTEKLEKVAEEFAIDFAEWFIDSEGKPKGEWSIKELLEIYKKEKEL